MLEDGQSREVQRRDGLYGFEFLEVDKRRTNRETRWELKQLWPRNRRIVRLAAMGYKSNVIAEILGITPSTVSDTLNSELGKLLLSEFLKRDDDETRNVALEIGVLTEKAIEVYHEIFDNEKGEASLKDRKNVADTVMLELSGLRAPTRIQSQSFSTVLTPEELIALKERGMKTARESGMFIDVEAEEEECPKTECR